MHENERVVREGYRAFLEGDVHTLSEMLAEDILWHVPGNSPIAGDHLGKEQVFAFFGKLWELTGGDLSLQIVDCCANDERAFVLARTHAKAGELTFESTDVSVYEFRDGKVVEATFFPENVYAADTFWTVAAQAPVEMTIDGRTHVMTPF